MAVQLQSTIALTEVLKFLFDRSSTKPEPFSITAISFDDTRKSGGDILKYQDCIVPRYVHFSKKKAVSAVPAPTGKPYHRENNTINIQPSNLKHPVKVHIDLIVEFNGKKVIC